MLLDINKNKLHIIISWTGGMRILRIQADIPNVLLRTGHVVSAFNFKCICHNTGGLVVIIIQK